MRHTADNNLNYLPDGAVDLDEPAPAPRPLWATLVIFLAVFAALQFGWHAARGTWVERLVVHDITVTPAATLVRSLTPDIAARAVGSSIKAPGGGLNILNGCEGTEVIFLLVAAFCTVRMPWRHRALAMLAGVLLVLALNQARILVLFYAFRSHRTLFDSLHTAVLPAVLVAFAAAYFYAALHLSQRRLA